ncbi:site-specific integrase [Longispora fulva]|uniref:tyrosine-type recombinase/integrase n=1 Tax=Longispora fulva TaxID=619741 RepID=UPI0018CA83D4|nr:site-specific integrase [Longispora fulva]GIG57754.1 site-specific integrase [Longispora fulva]
MPRKKRPEGTRAPNNAASIYLGNDGRWHGRVTMGVLDDGKPDRRHVSAKTETEVITKVRDLEKARDAGNVKRPGKPWTLEKWLAHWLDNIAAPNVRQNTIAGYRVAVRVHLIPGLGKHRLDKLTAEHIEKLYRKMQDNGSAPATAHQVHRTLRTALNQAVRRGYLPRNPVLLATAPQLDDEEIEPYSIEEAQRLLAKAAEDRNGTRWAFALALGLRQGEALGLQWDDVDLDKGEIRIRRSRLRPTYGHGCGDTCGKKAGYCPQRHQTNADTDKTKSRAGRRRVGLPAELVRLLREHKTTQDEERRTACQLWEEGGWVFATPTGRPINPRYDYDEWKRLLVAAELRDGRLHDARHTAATVLLLLNVQQRVVLDTMGWSTDQTGRYQHVTDPLRKITAQRIGNAMWKPKKKDKKERKTDSEGGSDGAQNAA